MDTELIIDQQTMWRDGLCVDHLIGGWAEWWMEKHTGRWGASCPFQLIVDEVTIAAFKGFENSLYHYEFLEYFDTAEQKDGWLKNIKKDFSRRQLEGTNLSQKKRISSIPVTPLNEISNGSTTNMRNIPIQQALQNLTNLQNTSRLGQTNQVIPTHFKMTLKDIMKLNRRAYKTKMRTSCPSNKSAKRNLEKMIL
mmetsp:Transcript_5303/g.6903  ORF Transcript_5303/g.6903 Transcript_5303/m.6903 type:complete len:195 (+) Transcript_5303:97-681(+)